MYYLQKCPKSSHPLTLGTAICNSSRKCCCDTEKEDNARVHEPTERKLNTIYIVVHLLTRVARRVVECSPTANLYWFQILASACV